MSLRQRIRLFQQLAVLLRAGLPVRASVERMRERLGGRELAALAQQLGEGQRLGEAFAAAGFLPFESNLVGAGERSGQLETIFDHLAQFWQRELDFRQAIVSPLIYPIVVLNFSVVLGCGIELITQNWVVAAVDFVKQIIALYLILGLLYAVARFTWSSPVMKNLWLRVPLVGRALRAAFAYRWITSLRLEFGAGLPISRAIGDAWRASGFADSERLAREGEEAVRAGTSLTALVTAWRQLPRHWIDFFETGELSGQFDQAFTNLEAEAARDWTLAQQRMSNWLPKILYFFALLVVAAQVVEVGQHAILDPIQQVQNEIDNTGK